MLGRTALCRRLVFCLLQWPPYRAATKKMPFRTSGVSFEKSALGEGRGVWEREPPSRARRGSPSPHKNKPFVVALRFALGPVTTNFTNNFNAYRPYTLRLP